MVNTAARVEGALDKKTDEIVISKAVQELIAHLDDVHAVFVRTAEAKNKAEPLDIYRVVWRPDELADLSPPAAESPGAADASPQVLSVEEDPLAVVESHYNRGAYDEAVEALEAFLEAPGPRETEAWIWLGRVQLGRNEPAKALKAFEKAVDLDPANPESHSGKGQALLRTGDFDQAVEALRQAAEISPEHEDRLFEVQYRLEQEVTRDPQAFRTRLVLAKATALGGKDRAALAHALRAAHDWPADALDEIESALEGPCFFALQEAPGFREIRAELAERRRSEEAYARALAEGTSALEQSRLQAAGAQFRSCLELRPDAEEPQVGMAEIAERRDEVAQHLSRAEAKRAEEDPEGALRALDLALAIDRENGQVLSERKAVSEELARETRISELLEEAGQAEAGDDFARAAALTESVLEEDPEHATAKTSLARLRQELDRRARFETYMAQSRQSASSRAYRKAAERADEALAIYPDDPTAVRWRRAVQAALEKENLPAFCGGPLPRKLARISLDRRLAPTREEVRSAAGHENCLPLDLDRALAAVGDCLSEIRQARMNEHAVRVRGYILQSAFATAEGEIDQIESLEPGSDVARELRRLVEDRRRHMAAQAALVETCRGLMADEAYERVLEELRAHPELLRENGAAEALKRGATQGLASAAAVRKAVDAVDRMEADGRPTDALYQILRIRDSGVTCKRSTVLIQDRTTRLRKRVFDADRSEAGGLPDDIVGIPASGLAREGAFRGLPRVFLNRYGIAATPVTRERYAEFLEWIQKDGHVSCHSDEPEGHVHEPDSWCGGAGDGPVCGVDWFDAYACTRWMGGRLPTEAEWLVAARYLLADPSNTNSAVLCGLAWEWCGDYHGRRFPASTSWARNPAGPGAGDARVLRAAGTGAQGRSRGFPQLSHKGLVSDAR